MEPIFRAADLLLPAEGTNLERWCALACDQFTSQPDYWRAAEALVGDAPSTLRLTLPEVYLEASDVPLRIQRIHAEMERCAATVLTRALHGFLLVERETNSGVRAGLVGMVDLEQYSYEPGAAPLVRPSENTVVERIPPRLAVRRGALLETPHIMMLVDDPAASLIEPLVAARETLVPLYDTALMLGGGHVRGWAITNAQQIAAIEQAITAFGTQAAFDAAYPQASGKPPLALAVGDGNHSLATAKAYWEALKTQHGFGAATQHPARFALVELVNIHSPAIVVEPIHRAVFGADAASFAQALRTFLQESGAHLCESADAQQTVTLLAPGACATHPSDVISFQNAPHPLAVGTLEQFLAAFSATHSGVRVDYIHGASALQEICATQQAIGVLLPEFAKADLFKGVVLGGVLPKKTFSMGEAIEKRYYLECRRITCP